MKVQGRLKKRIMPLHVMVLSLLMVTVLLVLSADKVYAQAYVKAYEQEEAQETVQADVQQITQKEWSSAKIGTQSSGMDTPVYTSSDNKLTLNTGVNGKMANTGQSGFVTYYTKLESEKYNFTIRGRFHVTGVDKQDNQSSFGIILFDTLPSNSKSADYINQLDVYAATKSEATGTCIPGVRLYTGNTDTTGVSSVGGVCDVTKYFDKNATVFSKSNAASLYYNFELVKDCNGYICNWYSNDWSTIDKSIRIYNPAKFLTQDATNVYVGFYASRIGQVEVTDISFEKHTPTDEETAAIDKSLWVEYDSVKVSTFNGNTTSDSDYRYRFTSNVTGTVTITDSLGHSYYTDKEIADGDTIEFKMSDYGYELPVGTTEFVTVVTPYGNSVDKEGVKAYEDRLLLKSYSPVTVKNSVTMAELNNSSSIVYVSPSGTSDGDGTKLNPYDIYTATAYAKAGQTIVLLDGTYYITKTISIPYSQCGTKDNYITIKAENTKKAIINGSKMKSGTLLTINGDYWHIYGLDMCYSHDGSKGVQVSGNHNIIEMCDIHDNGTTGLQISCSGGEPRVWWPSYNTILNCSSYFNCDSKQNDADGFAAKLSAGEGNVFDGCISYNNADDGYDLYAKDMVGGGPIGAVTIKNSLAYNNGILKDGSYSQASANGFKLGGEGLTGKHVLQNCISWNNGGCGIMSNNGPDCRVYNCISVDNGLFSRVGKTDGRNNYQLSPRNGSKYGKNTGFALKNSIGFYTSAITSSSALGADKIVYIGQEKSEFYNTNNYLCNDISSRKCVNSSGTQVKANWFESVDYSTITPVRNSEGSIDMNGLFVLTSNAPEGVGASISKKEDATETPTEEPTENVTEEASEEATEEPTEKPTEAPTEKPTEAPTEKPTEVPTETPTEAPTERPTEKPTEAPTETPTEAPTEPENSYIGDVNTELQKFSYNNDTNYLSGQMVVVEWVDIDGDDVKESTVPKYAPKMQFVSTDGTETIDVFVTATGTNTYYFDRLLSELTEGKEYVFKVTSGNPDNVSQYKTVPIYTGTSAIGSEGVLGKVGNQKLCYSTADDGTLLLSGKQPEPYNGNVNSLLTQVNYGKSEYGDFITGNIIITEWIDGVSTVPETTPKMTFESYDGTEVNEVFMACLDGTNTYYFDRNLNGNVDTTKEYIFRITLTEPNNVSEYKSMVATTNEMSAKEGVLWETDTQVIKYKTVWADMDNQLRVYAVNK